MKVEEEGITGWDGLSIQMAGAEDERPGPVGQAAGTASYGHRFERAGIETGCADFAGLWFVAVRGARNTAESDSQSAAQHVRGYAGGKLNRFFC